MPSRFAPNSPNCTRHNSETIHPALIARLKWGLLAKNVMHFIPYLSYSRGSCTIGSRYIPLEQKNKVRVLSTHCLPDPMTPSFKFNTYWDSSHLAPQKLAGCTYFQ